MNLHEAAHRLVKVVRFIEVVDSAFRALGVCPKQEAARVAAILSSRVLFGDEIWEGWAAQARVNKLSDESRQAVVAVYRARASS